MNVTRSWKRLMAVGCSHGPFIDQAAKDAVVGFRKNWIRPGKGDRVIHLGDFTDLSAFMSKAKGEGDPIKPDVDQGLSFLEQLKVTDVLAGNHEARIYRELSSKNEIVQLAADILVEKIEGRVRKLRASWLPYRGVWNHLHIGNFKFTHGTMYGENATRDHAEAHGNVVHAHTHRAGVAKGRRDDNPTGFSVGTLTRQGAMEYADTKKSTLSWSQGFVWGEYCDDLCVLWLHEQPTTSTEWRLPV
jgi:hypothetical protein